MRYALLLLGERANLMMTFRMVKRFIRFSAPTTPTSLDAKALWRQFSASSICRDDVAANTRPPLKARRMVPRSGSYPLNFLASGVATGVKRRPTSESGEATDPPLDLALVVSSTPGTTYTAAVFTKNLFTAAPVAVSKAVCKETSGKGVAAVILNSGCANAVTGAQGSKDAWSMVKATETALQSRYSTWRSASEVEGGSKAGVGRSVVMSTGVIGQLLRMDKIIPGIDDAADRLGSSHEDWLAAAEATMTTDTFPKLRSRTAVLPSTGTEYRIAGFSKGAGMIHPDMATMLAVVVTDAPVRGAALQSALSYAVERSFNSITVDGDTSTNDTLILMANGACTAEDESVKGKEIRWIDADQASEDYVAFRDELANFAAELAQLIVRDGEGATKFITIKVKNAPSVETASTVAKTVASSSLVKTAMYGRDANWGRVLCAVGYTDGVAGIVDPSKVSLALWNPEGRTSFEEAHPLLLLEEGEPRPFDEATASKILQEEDICLTIDLGDSKGKEATVWTCDLSHDYVTINGSYRT